MDVNVVVKHSKDFGRHLIAKRDIKSGEKILTEAPLVVSPITDPITDHKIAICIRCCRRMKYKHVLLCQCSWPFCSKTCLNSHTDDAECTLFSDNDILWSRERSSLMYLFRSILFRDTDLDKWNEIMDLDSTYGTVNPEHESIDEKTINTGMAFLEKCRFNVSREEVKKLVQIFAINSFSFDKYDKKQNSSQIFGAVYHKSSLLAHSCSPNAKILKVEDFNIEIHTMVDIKEGDMVTITYAKKYLYQQTKERRIGILKAYSFICQCSRCNDPTELGTFYSSLKCPWCKTGYLNPPKATSGKLYKCTNCWFFTPKWIVSRKEKKFIRKVEDIQSMAYGLRQEKLSRVISKATTSCWLHSNHKLVVLATNEWLSMLDTDLLFGSPPRDDYLYMTIASRASQLMTVYEAFGMFCEPSFAKMDNIVAIYQMRFNWKRAPKLPLFTKSGHLRLEPYIERSLESFDEVGDDT